MLSVAINYTTTGTQRFKVAAHKFISGLLVCSPGMVSRSLGSNTAALDSILMALGQTAGVWPEDILTISLRRGGCLLLNWPTN